MVKGEESTVVSDDGGLGNVSSSNELVIDVTLPRHGVMLGGEKEGEGDKERRCKEQISNPSKRRTKERETNH